MDKDRDSEVESNEKICSFSDSGDQEDVERLRCLTEDSRYVCGACGRTARNEENLCSPEPL